MIGLGDSDAWSLKLAKAEIKIKITKNEGLAIALTESDQEGREKGGWTRKKNASIIMVSHHKKPHKHPRLQIFSQFIN